MTFVAGNGGDLAGKAPTVGVVLARLVIVAIMGVFPAVMSGSLAIISGSLSATLLAMDAGPRATASQFTSQGMKVKVDEVFSADQIKQNDVIWGLAFLSADELLATTKSGSLLRLNLKTQHVQTIAGLPQVDPHGQGGLMDIHLHPNFAKNAWLYFSYSVRTKSESWTTRIARAQLKKNELTKLQVLFTADIESDDGVHFGSRIVFDNRGYLFFGVGDRGQRQFAQSLSHHNGKIFRLHDDGRVPTDNPFVKVKGARPEIWAYGIRNPQGLTRHFETGELWENEHGPRGGDEINRILPGKNYGWPVITFGREYWGPKIGEGTQKPGMESPLYQFTPSIAPSSLMIYSGKLFKAWKGDFFSSSLVLQHLNRLSLKNGLFKEEERLLSSMKERFRHVVESPEGHIFLSTDSGKIIRLSQSLEDSKASSLPSP